MAMEKQFMMTDTHTKAVTAIGFHPIRREIVIGFEDGLMKWWEQDSGKLMLTTHGHRGWLTDFVYWADPKLLLSSANDGMIIAWGSSGNIVDRIQMERPIYCMTFNLRRQHFICTFNSQLRIYSLDVKREYGHVIDLRKPFVAEHHKDIIPCVICNESRVYTAGFDAAICIYDTTLYPGTKGLDLIHKNSRAHEAGITCMALVKDNENNTWLLTGSFDRSVKVWSQDGKLRHQLETIFLSTITSLCYVQRAKTVWISSGMPHATLYDPKAGENVSEFLPTFQTEVGSGEEPRQRIFKLRYNPDSSQVVGTTHRRQIIVWKYNTSGCMTALKCKHAIDSVSYTRKVPMLLFTGGSDGSIYKWERLQSSPFMYSMECLTRKEANDKLEAIKKIRGLAKKRLHPLTEHHRHIQASPSSHYSYNKSLVAPSSLYQSKNLSLLRCEYIEHLDLLVTSSEDGHIYLWGFDQDAVNALRKLTPEQKATQVRSRKYSVLFDDLRQNTMEPKAREKLLYGEKISDLIGAAKGTLDEAPVPDPEAGGDATSATEKSGNTFTDSVTNRVAGFICKDVLIGHDSCVTSFIVVDKEAELGTTFMLSGGWDRRILLWNMRTGQLHDQLRSAPKIYYDKNTGKELPREKVGSGDDEDDMLQKGELACDGVILSMEYCPERNEFAYASSDGMVYIRDFSTVGYEMKLRNTLQGHELEITCVRWNKIYKKWITGSEDGTIRVWSDDGMTCERILSIEGSVSTMCIDSLNGCIVAAVDNQIKVYDMENWTLVQVNVGHTDSIRSIVHVHERSQYVSGSWDKSIRIWNAYRRPIRRRKPPALEGEEKPKEAGQEEKKVVIA